DHHHVRGPRGGGRRSRAGRGRSAASLHASAAGLDAVGRVGYRGRTHRWPAAQPFRASYRMFVPPSLRHGAGPLSRSGASGSDSDSGSAGGLSRDCRAAHQRWRDDVTELLALTNVTKTYRQRRRVVTAVENVTFTLHAGQILCLVGESGSGKSTIGRIVTGLTTPTTGEIRYSERPVAGMTRKELRAHRLGVQL